ncbi:hypothetical protein BDA96_04G016900 [Sorghum bicolor]|uniref:Knottin scorpion toxin-like domain-containing protein n=2 Tax=Sorghum bicolor TaxID=4558 RepID=A0A921R0X0_SORBI|nr:hypothetical protein BDA96_04G016900 [Sorghum bicolor]KXG29308.1 hypothetical protein SORBI_3004G015000 [Sorghum bicolor]
MVRTNITMKMQKILVLLMLIILVAPQEKMEVGAEEPCIETNPFPKCFGSCFRPGNCNNCCKDRGYTRGNCLSLGCTCCK